MADLHGNPGSFLLLLAGLHFGFTGLPTAAKRLEGGDRRACRFRLRQCLCVGGAEQAFIGVQHLECLARRGLLARAHRLALAEPAERVRLAVDDREELRRRGHVVKYAVGPCGGYQAIGRDPLTGAYWGASEFRKDGQAAGY